MLTDTTYLRNIPKCQKIADEKWNVLTSILKNQWEQRYKSLLICENVIYSLLHMALVAGKQW